MMVWTAQTNEVILMICVIVEGMNQRHILLFILEYLVLTSRQYPGIRLHLRLFALVAGCSGLQNAT